MSLAVLVGLAACGEPEVVAVVDGASIGAEQLAALHPDGADVGSEQLAASTYLLVLHRLLVTHAATDFDLAATDAAIDTAFGERAGGVDDSVDERLTNRGVTRARVRLESELDVVRALVEEEFVRRGGSGIDLDAAYRQFISVNSQVCMVMLAPVSADAEPRIEAFISETTTIDDVLAGIPDAVESVDLGCASPVQHPQPLQPVAVDGEIGRAYLRAFDDGTMYVAGVIERDAPDMNDVMDEVVEIAARSQGSALFEQWAFGILSSADVRIDRSIGTWESTPDTGDVPTVVAP